MSNLFGFSNLFGGGGGGGGWAKPPESHKVVEIEDVDEFKDELKDNSLILIDFHAEWCGPCQMIKPVVQNMSNEYTNVRFLAVDVDEQQEIAAQFRVRAMPTFVFIKDMKLVDMMKGADPEGLESMVVKNGGVKGGSKSDGKFGDTSGGHRLGSSNDDNEEEQLPFVDELVGMGYNKAYAIKAVKATGEESLQKAIDWTLSNPDTGASTQDENLDKDTSLSGDECIIKIRLSSGDVVTPPKLTSNTTLAEVREWVEANTSESGIRLMSTFPKKKYSGDDEQLTLEQADLAPRGELVVTKE